MGKLRNALFAVGLVVVSALAVFAVLEVGTRLLVPSELWRFEDSTFDWDPDPRLGWINKPHQDDTRRHMGPPVRYRTSPDGLIPHDTRREKEPGRTRIMVFGDSMVVGRSEPQEKIYTAQLEEILNERGYPAEVVNAAVLGYSTDQALLLMGRWLPIYQPDIVLFGSTLNDFGGNSLGYANSQSKPRFEVDGGALRLIPPDPTDRLNSRRGQGLRAWIQHSAFYRALQPRIYQVRAKLGDWRQKNLLGLMQGVYVDRRQLESFDWPLFGLLLRSMDNTASAHHAQLLVYAHPEVGEVWEPYVESMAEMLRVPRGRYNGRAVHERIARVAREQGVHFVPTFDYFAEQQERGPFHRMPRDAHFSVVGHRIMAEALADHLIESGLIPPADPGAESGRSDAIEANEPGAGP